jgi:hypothetical protein
MSEPREQLECGDYIDENGNQYICEKEECQECCPHDDIDHFQCIYCGKEFCPSRFFDEDAYKGYD